MSFLGLYDFNGSVKRNKVADAVMESMNDRERFLKNLEEQRKSRALDTRQRSAVIRLQRFWRRHLAKAREQAVFRRHFDEAGRSTELPVLLKQMARLNLFYRHSFPEDKDRLVSVCSDALTLSRSPNYSQRPSSELIPSHTRLIFTKRILSFLAKSGADTNFTMPIRFLETFVTKEDYAILIKKSYFESILSLLCAVVPERDSQQDIQIEDHYPGRIGILCEQLVAPLAGISDGKEIVQATARLLKCVFEHPDRLAMVTVVLPYMDRFRDKKLGRATYLSCIAATPLSSAGSSQVCAYTVSRQISKEDQQVLSCEADANLLLHILAETTRRAHAIGDSAEQKKSDVAKSNGENGTAMEVDHVVEKVDIFMSNAVDGLFESFMFLNLCIQCGVSPNGDMADVVLFYNKLVKSHMLSLLARSPVFISRLFHFLMGMGPPKSVLTQSSSNSQGNYVEHLKSGWGLSEEARRRVMPALSMLCHLVTHQMQSTLDDDMAVGGKAADGLPAIVAATRELRDISLGLIDLAFPEDFWSSRAQQELKKKESAEWSSVYELVVSTLQSVYRKDLRVRFLPDDFWIEHKRQVVLSRNTWQPMPRRQRGRHGQQAERPGPFAFVRYLRDSRPSGVPGVGGAAASDSEGSGDEDPHALPPSSSDLRNLSIIRSVPFLVPFQQRLKIFQELLAHDKNHHGITEDWMSGARIAVSVRRPHLYEDSMDALSAGKAPNMRLPIRVHMINWAGIDEIGQDGGGIFREFLSELLKTAFDPNRGLFTYTHDRLLFPNPTSLKLYPDNYSQHYYFLGRIIAKLIYEGQMMDMRFADFFLIQLLSYRIPHIDLEQMKSYDPTVYKHLRSLLTYSAHEVDELSLDFSVIVDALGTNQNMNLKENGRNIRVTIDNRNEYVQLYVNFFLNKRLEPLIDAMRAGVSDVIELSWLSMFDPSELQMIVSGVDADIDIDDMRRNCEVYNKRDNTDEEYMAGFWRVAGALNREDKAAMLKFITGCSRPPIDGFRNLHPQLGIQLVHDVDAQQLPMSATCMNLFKLPRYADLRTLEEKLKYAINSGAGFEMA